MFTLSVELVFRKISYFELKHSLLVAVSMKLFNNHIFKTDSLGSRSKIYGITLPEHNGRVFLFYYLYIIINSVCLTVALASLKEHTRSPDAAGLPNCLVLGARLLSAVLTLAHRIEAATMLTQEEKMDVWGNSSIQDGKRSN